MGAQAVLSTSLSAALLARLPTQPHFLPYASPVPREALPCPPSPYSLEWVHSQSYIHAWRVGQKSGQDCLLQDPKYEDLVSERRYLWGEGGDQGEAGGAVWGGAGFGGQRSLHALLED